MSNVMRDPHLIFIERGGGKSVPGDGKLTEWCNVMCFRNSENSITEF